ncbi:MAG: 6,7-dimethyl-8-ribityllumazine synthase [Candidatus Makaraimicrobium thalassicum]|nr:MAG: 6,7-dimethyl-8-ribityllumazine synthase [Candidatus Omnitrophota bacterium]
MAGSKIVKGSMMAKNKRFGIVVSRFNEFVSSKLLEGALDTLLKHGVKENDISVVWVPGSFEIPVLAKKIAGSGKYDAVVCLGTIIRGETPHFDFIASEAAKGVAKVAMESDIPCIFGIITADNLEQALDRAGVKSGNKGREAARTAIEMCNLYSEI